MFALSAAAWEPTLSPAVLYQASREIPNEDAADWLTEMAATLAEIRNLPETTERSAQ